MEKRTKIIIVVIVSAVIIGLLVYFMNKSKKAELSKKKGEVKKKTDELEKGAVKPVTKPLIKLKAGAITTLKES